MTTYDDALEFMDYNAMMIKREARASEEEDSHSLVASDVDLKIEHSSDINGKFLKMTVWVRYDDE